MTKTSKKYDLCVVGGGAAGLMAAAVASSRGNSVVIVERNARFGVKLRITGKGRCNVTNDCGIQEFLAEVPVGTRFLYAALTAFSPSDTIEFFESHGVPLKTERGRRVFPVSDRASDIADCLVGICKGNGVDFVTGKVTSVKTENGAVCGVETDYGGFVNAVNVLLACGGASYPMTGSDGSGYALASALGHKIIDPLPSLVPLTSSSKLCSDCMGLSLKNVGVSFRKNGKLLYSEQGEMLFTHFGVSGPVVLSASAHLRCGFPVDMSIDLKPALDLQTLDARLLRDFSEEQNKDFINSLDSLLPQKLIPPFVALSGVDPRKKVNSVTKQERRNIATLLKALPVVISGTRPLAEAIVTSGGVDLKEINPKTMGSKLVEGLFFAGELLNTDAYTGGYNLQIAWSTAVAAANAV